MRAVLLVLAGMGLAGCVADPAATVATPYAPGSGPAYGSPAYADPAYAPPVYGNAPPGTAAYEGAGLALPAFPALPPGGPYPGPAVLLPYGGGYGRDEARARFDYERRLRAERERADWARFGQQRFGQQQFERQRFEQQRFEQQRAQGLPGPDHGGPRPIAAPPAWPVAERPPHPGPAGHEPPDGPHPRPDWR